MSEHPVDPVATAGQGLPAPEEVREYLRAPVGALSDVDLARIWAAVVAVQVQVCSVPADADGQPDPETWPAPLVQALLRRTQRHFAAKNLPLGYLDTANEFGPARIPGLDAVIEELEQPYRRVVVA